MAQCLNLRDLNAPGCSTVTGPCIDQTVFGPTVASFYWSATTVATDPGLAWYVLFNSGGGVNTAAKFSATTFGE